MQKKNLQISLIIAVLFVILVFYIYQDLFDKSDDLTTSIINQTNDLIEGVEVTGNGEEDLIIEEITDGNIVIEDEQNIQKEVLPIPDLYKRIEFPDNLPEEAQASIIKKIDEIVKNLEKDPTSFDNWLELGIYRKMIEDYEGTKLVWEYAGYLKPNKFVVWGNLADLYAYYLKNNEKAEEYYLKALQYGSHQDYLYFKTAQFYTDFLNDKEKAIQIVQIGLEHSIDSQELKDLLTSLK